MPKSSQLRRMLFGCLCHSFCISRKIEILSQPNLPSLARIWHHAVRVVLVSGGMLERVANCQFLACFFFFTTTKLVRDDIFEFARVQRGALGGVISQIKRPGAVSECRERQQDNVIGRDKKRRER